MVFDIYEGGMISIHTNKQTNKQPNNNNKEVSKPNKILILGHLEISYNFSKVLNERVARILSRIYRLGEKSRVAEEGGSGGMLPRKCFDMNMR